MTPEEQKAFEAVAEGVQRAILVYLNRMPESERYGLKRIFENSIRESVTAWLDENGTQILRRMNVP